MKVYIYINTTVKELLEIDKAIYVNGLKGVILKKLEIRKYFYDNPYRYVFDLYVKKNNFC